MNSFYPHSGEDVDGTFYLQCTSCGKCVSSRFIPIKNEIGKNLVVRAVIKCPECMEQEGVDNATTTANIAIDGKTGPGLTFSLLNDGPINNARSMLFNFQTNCITIIDFSGKPHDIEMTGIATVTVAIASGVYTITVV